MKSHLFVLIGLILLTFSCQLIQCETINLIQQTNSVDPPTLNKQIFIDQSNTSYYFYDVYTDNGKIRVNIIDQDLKTYNLTFQKSNQLYFRAAYNKYIIVEQKNSTNNSVSYWVLTIVHSDKGFQLESFPVSSIQDNQDFFFEDKYLLTSILQYDRLNNFLYVTTNATTDFDVYGINLTQKSQKLITIGWFNYSSPPQNIIGGNSRVLVEANQNQIWIDTMNKRNDPNADNTIYDKINISSLTKYPIYPGGSRVYNLLGSYFQYVSLSQDQKNMTTFTYYGYDKAPVLGQGSLNSTQKPIKIFTDEQTYFLAVSDNDIYVSSVTWNETQQKYDYVNGTLDTFISDKSKQEERINNFYSALLVVYHNGSFYLLTQNKFIVYGLQTQYEKDLSQPVSSSRDLERILLTQMKAYNQANSTK